MTRPHPCRVRTVPQTVLAHGIAALLKDSQTLDKALSDPARLPKVPPGMPIGEDDQ